MIKTIVLFTLFVSNMIFSQQKAVTENGDEIFIYDDGTWKYVDVKNEEELFIPTNEKEFIKEKESTFLIKSSKIDVGFWINPKEWNFKKATSNSDAEYELQLKKGDLYGMIISEEIEVPLSTLKELALSNGKQAAPDLKIITEEYRIVNGLKVLMLQMNGTMNGIKFSYYGYYYSSTSGSVQFITYTSQSLLKKYKSKSESLLSGLTELKD